MFLCWYLKIFSTTSLKVSVKVNVDVSLNFFVFANLESVGCEAYFPEKNSEQLILKLLKSLFFVSSYNLRAKND